MSKEIKEKGNLPPFVLFRYQRKGFSLEDHLKRAGLPAGRYVHLNGDWACYGLEDNPKFRKANYLAVNSVGDVLGEERPVKGPKPKEEKAKKEAKEPVGKPAKKNGKKPPLKVKNPGGKVVEAA